jgi:hypothetical protein
MPDKPPKPKKRTPITIDATSLKPEQPQPLGIMDLMPQELQKQIELEISRKILLSFMRSIRTSNMNAMIKAEMLKGIMEIMAKREDDNAR